MSYTEAILKDLECNYIDLNNNNSNQMNQPCINREITNPSIIEGFANDSSSGSQYIPHGSCGDGQMLENNECVEVCNRCVTTKPTQPLHKKNNINQDHFNYIFTNVIQ
uniref:Uncharacterized protein n=1 Tax=viral metagenome TaxID=1070528 RepID=A0A6C0KZ44_9ZZZZ|tara:strand:+ start:2751 stop:3074 length:324 start_codon:yes stop_codon:yes gene_type:complete